MNQDRNAWRRTFALAALLPMALMPVSFSAAGETDCAQALAWVEGQRGELPTSFQEISALPRAYTRAIFSALSPSQRSDFRQEQLDFHLMHNPQWTADQKEIVHQAHRLYSPEFFRPEPQSLAWISTVLEPFEAFRAQALQVFDQREFQEIFVKLGRVSEADDEDEVNAFPCNCNLALDNHCVSTNCTPKATGCGPTGGSRCNGHFAAFPDPVPFPDDGIRRTILR